MLYSLTNEELRKLFDIDYFSDFVNAGILVTIFKTNMNVIKEVIPKPLSPTEDAFVG